ncbi:MAG: ABC transporter ATP-binding protein [Akkermansiaceae bacterium]|nr:ABC transporter ATP-binding protein [Akkermansiaceae bacterium]MCP5545447.1 ABC transporter ATP-binding protein [Akkermansiaceae bacterium]MCP5548967.1 ABC transporter ATP-binding protein [Akkermansiaceae bacterium]
MSETIIEVKDLSKCYRIGRNTSKGDGLRHVLESAVRAPFAWLKPEERKQRARTEDFWAVRDVSVEIKRGEMVGIIGRNGAGKSTLLKLLSRITEPTKGNIRLRGRVASLLEVGTGFHPELTGRENIYLNGAILGMSRVEIKRKFDEIVAFSEIEKFLDTPVKRYSSGMYVRLAFAVAAHLEPEILIVDEVLAVGDAEFQKKCLGKMEDVSQQQGRTVILVSHQMPAIQNLCTRCLLMDKGQLIMQGGTDEIVNSYMTKGAALATEGLVDREDRTGKGNVRITSIDLRDPDGNVIHEAISGHDVVLSLGYETKDGAEVNDCVFCVEVAKDLKNYFSLSSALVDRRPLSVRGRGRIDFLVPNWPLMGGRYHINFYVGSNKGVEDYLNDASVIDAIDGDFYGTGKLHHEGWQGVSVLVKHSWTKHEEG